ncbi:L-ribulose-5-phosphate 4-epimerase [Sedimentisphaera salicampi]|uniref:L-ribulose-5-phosphate 4-epimerase n=1 Tax=Sedimentisphaera salicampi TaxID=1941349 RepID=UPI000B9ADAC6|nr:L-ribulose-5-phosphate 4-epimerase [Sedimentisphaera salicampi]OXU15227.1 L-ribulose-5-phosphate 4-epimerase [Sedimentisphaera salicampi]
MLEELKKEVCRANLELSESGLVILSWGNVSGIDRSKGIFAIKPSGIDYAKLKPEDIVLVSLEGEKVEGDMKPSSDTPTHLELYRQWSGIGGVCHTHSPCATAFAQAKRELPCLGTTHADNFYGTVPVTRQMAIEEIETEYELNTGKVICERFKGIDPETIPAVFCAGHGPFTWGKDAGESVKNAIVLEMACKMGLDTLSLAGKMEQIPQTLLDKHYLRKHGKGAYYGQN